VEIDLTSIEPIYGPLSEVKTELSKIGLTLPDSSIVSITPVASCSKDVVPDVKPEIKVTIIFLYFFLSVFELSLCILQFSPWFCDEIQNFCLFSFIYIFESRFHHITVGVA